MARRFGITTTVNTHPSMVLGTSEVRLIDMTRAFASVANKGVAVTPFGITRVTADNEVIYEHEVDRSRVLVAPYVAAEMTDLLQTTVNTGTGRAAQIGRPGRGQDRHDELVEGRLVPRLLLRAHHRRVDGARRCQTDRRAARRHRPGARPSRNS